MYQYWNYPILWFSTSIGRVHYQYWHSTKVPVPVLALYIGSVPVWARSITGTGIPTWCPYWYWHFCTLVQNRYKHSLLPVLAFRCGTGIDKYVLGISTSMGTFHYRNWNSIMPYQYWHFCTLVQYQYGQIPLLVLTINDDHTGIGIYAFWSSTSIGMVHYRYWN